MYPNPRFQYAVGVNGLARKQLGGRPQYSEGYYACFVFDLDGHNIEAMLEIARLA